MALPLYNNAETGSDDTTVTTGNSGGANANAFDGVTIGTNMTLTYDNVYPGHGSLAFKYALTSTSTDATYVVWSSSSVGSGITEIYGAVYVTVDNNGSGAPTSSVRFIGFYNSGTVLCGMKLASGGTRVHIDITTGTSWTSVATGPTTADIFAGDLARIEFHYLFNVGSGEVARLKLFAGDSGTPAVADTVLSDTNLGASFDEVRIGCNTNNFSSTSGAAFWVDDLYLGAPTWPGPGPYAASSATSLLRTYKRLYGPAQLTATPTDLYTTPAGTQAVIRKTRVNNPSPEPVDFTMSVGTDTASSRLWDAYEIAGNGSPHPSHSILDDHTDHTLAAGEKIQAWFGIGNPTTFPVTALLDDFNRADESPITTNWTTPMKTGENNCRVVSNQFAPAASGTWSSAYYDLAQFGECEAYFTIAAIDLDKSVYLHARTSGVGTGSLSGYALYWEGHSGSDDYFSLYRVDSGTPSLLNAAASGNLAVGDAFAIRCSGDQIETWRRVSGAWSVASSVTDATYATGYLGVEIEGNATRLDNFGGGNVSPYAAEVLADGPVAYYRMDEASGQPQDSSGYGNHTTAVGGSPDYSQTGGIASDPSSTAIAFVAASGEYFTAPDHTTLDVGDVFTLEAWIKRSSFGTEVAIMGKGQTGGAVQQAPSLYMASDNTLMLVQEGYVVMGNSTTTITDTNWHHVAATKNGTTVKLYIDGVDVTGTTSGNACVNTTRVFGVGAIVGNTGNPALFFPGSLDEVAVYPTALSAERIKAHYDAAKPPVIIIDGYEEAV